MYLRDYYSILREKNLPKYLSTKRILIDADLDLSLENLWKAHRERKKGKTSLLDLKIELANRMYDNCEFCERRCKLSRREKRGTCKVKKSRVASEFAHHGEEAPLVPSHTIFFSGCNFKCVFCQNWDISQNLTGRFFEPEEIARLIERRNLKNVNFVGGEPTPNLLYILKVLRFCEAKIPVVWNSNMYMTFEVMELLDGVVDLYLTDFKYGNDECAKKYSKVKNYFEIVSRNHKLSEKHAELLIRHLVLPNHLECCTYEILKWISENLNSPVVNVMFQYRPCYLAGAFPEINRYLTSEERSQALEFADEFGISLV